MDAWLSGALHFELLMGWLDSQHKTYVKIGYWEDLVLKLAFESNLDKQEAKFREISLVDHHCRLINYSSDIIMPPKSPSPALRSPSHSPSPSNVVQQIQYQCGWSKLFQVSPVFRPFVELTNSPCKATSAKFIAGLWNNAHMTTLHYRRTPWLHYSIGSSSEAPT